MIKEWYDKNEYENYPSYLMGVKKENKTDMGYGAPSPINTPGNVQKYGAESWMHTTDVIQGEAEAYQSPYTFNNCRIREYEFSKSDIPQSNGVFIPDVGIGASIIVEGTSRIINNNQLEVSMSAIIVKDIQISGSVIVKQQGITIDSCQLKLYNGGYIYESGAMKPIGEAVVELPYNGRYEVQVLVSALHSSAGQMVFNTTIDLPYSK